MKTKSWKRLKRKSQNIEGDYGSSAAGRKKESLLGRGGKKKKANEFRNDLVRTLLR